MSGRFSNQERYRALDHELQLLGIVVPRQIGLEDRAGVQRERADAIAQYLIWKKWPRWFAALCPSCRIIQRSTLARRFARRLH